jgi:RNA recognition motif-containing protein
LLQSYGKINDIKLIKEGPTGKNRDFAFVEFNTMEEAEGIVNISKSQPIIYKGLPLYITFSKFKKGDPVLM